MIARVWRGWASSVENADRYQEFLQATFLPSIRARELLSRFEARCQHFELVVADTGRAAG